MADYVRIATYNTKNLFNSQHPHHAKRPRELRELARMVAKINAHILGVQEVENERALAELNQLPENLGQVKRAALDSGFFSEDNVQRLEKNEIEPYIACGRQSHNLTLEERLATAPALPENPDTITAMKHRLKTEVGKQFYAKRKSTVEPVFGIIKEVMGFRRFLLRGLNAVTGEWTLVCIAFNLKRLCTLSA